ncbi:MAG: hypothetical protein HY317_04280 [Acidobacteria bacterium]|nr:hypothetical protein [Acidobacteriota bacterium]
MRSERRLVFAVCGVLGALSGSLTAAEVVERILAVVNDRPVMLSEVALLGAVRGLDRATAVEAVIDERLMFEEAARLPQAVVGAEDEERAYQSLLGRGSARGALEADLRRLARRETAILRYVEFRFRQQVRVTDEAVRAAYEAEHAGREDAAAYDAVAPALRERLEDAALDARIEAWVKELRGAARIRYNAGGS